MKVNDFLVIILSISVIFISFKDYFAEKQIQSLNEHISALEEKNAVLLNLCSFLEKENLKLKTKLLKFYPIKAQVTIKQGKNFMFTYAEVGKGLIFLLKKEIIISNGIGIRFVYRINPKLKPNEIIIFGKKQKTFIANVYLLK